MKRMPQGMISNQALAGGVVDNAGLLLAHPGSECGTSLIQFLGPSLPMVFQKKGMFSKKYWGLYLYYGTELDILNIRSFSCFEVSKVMRQPYWEIWVVPVITKNICTLSMVF
jgi:hypothetical protein